MRERRFPNIVFRNELKHRFRIVETKMPFANPYFLNRSADSNDSSNSITTCFDNLTVNPDLQVTFYFLKK